MPVHWTLNSLGLRGLIVFALACFPSCQPREEAIYGESDPFFEAKVNRRPAAISVSPRSGSGRTQTFRFRFRDPDGADDLAWGQFVISEIVGPVDACHGSIYFHSRTIYLMNDEANGLTKPLEQGQPGTIGNSRCSVAGREFRITHEDGAVVAWVPITFERGWDRPAKIYLRTADHAGEITKFRDLASWRTADAIPPASPKHR